MDISVLYNLPDFLLSVWAWAGNQDSRIAFLLGVLTWVVVGQIFSLFDSPVQKVLSFCGFVLVVLIALGSWVSFSGTLEPGEIPYMRATITPNVDTLMEIQE